MTRLLSFLRPCPLRVVTAEEIRAVAGASRDDTVQAIGLDGRRATGEWAESYEANARMILDVLGGQNLTPYVGGWASQANAPSGLELQDTASNSRRWR